MNDLPPPKKTLQNTCLSVYKTKDLEPPDNSKMDGLS